MLPPDAAEISCLRTQTGSAGCPEGQPVISPILISYGALGLPARPHCPVAVLGTVARPFDSGHILASSRGSSSMWNGDPRETPPSLPNHLFQILRLSATSVA